MPLQGNGSINVVSSASTQVKVSSNDTTPGYLNGKLIAGTNITLTEGSDGSNETLTISSGSLVEFITRTIEGVVYETTLMYWVCPATAVISSCNMYLGSNPSASTTYCKVQVMKNGILETNSVFTSDAAMQVTETTSAVNGIYPASGTLDSGQTALAAGDVLWFRVNQADAGSADLTIRVKVTYS
jgi:hypothetical protein